MGILCWFQTATMNLNRSEAKKKYYGMYYVNLKQCLGKTRKHLMCSPYLSQNVVSQEHIISNQKE
jgi:hypothetical protein